MLPCDAVGEAAVGESGPELQPHSLETLSSISDSIAVTQHQRDNCPDLVHSAWMWLVPAPGVATQDSMEASSPGPEPHLRTFWAAGCAEAQPLSAPCAVRLGLEGLPGLAGG